MLFDIPIPMWLVSVQLFWLGGIGFSNAIIWTPFIKKAIARAASFSGRHHRIHISSNSGGENSIMTSAHLAKENAETSVSPSGRMKTIIVTSEKSPSGAIATGGEV